MTAWSGRGGYSKVYTSNSGAATSWCPATSKARSVWQSHRVRYSTTTPLPRGQASRRSICASAPCARAPRRRTPISAPCGATHWFSGPGRQAQVRPGSRSHMRFSCSSARKWTASFSPVRRSRRGSASDSFPAICVRKSIHICARSMTHCMISWMRGSSSARCRPARSKSLRSLSCAGARSRTRSSSSMRRRIRRRCR